MNFHFSLFSTTFRLIGIRRYYKLYRCIKDKFADIRTEMFKPDRKIKDECFFLKWNCYDD